MHQHVPCLCLRLAAGRPPAAPPACQVSYALPAQHLLLCQPQRLLHNIKYTVKRGLQPCSSRRPWPISQSHERKPIMSSKKFCPANPMKQAGHVLNCAHLQLCQGLQLPEGMQPQALTQHMQARPSALKCFQRLANKRCTPAVCHGDFTVHHAQNPGAIDMSLPVSHVCRLAT